MIDFALTTPDSAEETFAAVTKRLKAKTDDDGDSAGDGGLGVRYKEPLLGGRKRKDGQDVKWHVTKPLVDDDAPNVLKPIEVHFPTGRVDTPFFCHDVTDRALRIPFAEKDISETHPCGARGIVSVEVVVREEKIDSYVKLYTSVLGVQPKVHGGHRSSPTTSLNFLLSTPNVEEPAMKALRGKVRVEIRAPRNQEDEVWLKERGGGIRAMNIFCEVKGEGEADEVALDSEGVGASVVLVKEPVGYWQRKAR